MAQMPMIPRALLVLRPRSHARPATQLPRTGGLPARLLLGVDAPRAVRVCFLRSHVSANAGRMGRVRPHANGLTSAESTPAPPDAPRP